ncbi:hypothetical protein HMP0015_1228 [Acinetobacter haemolyticus ATCC 19194]|uniref:Uncharacterized protein n=1 Tax=Acinetobacter haemolyticus ATCC 19194 TaxID=707232 RepID=D4XND6_ACIHA|nr:hypothetical protein HMP0015_1228 [Acinetobacter haemolyticus ATCC 19194]
MNTDLSQLLSVYFHYLLSTDSGSLPKFTQLKIGIKIAIRNKKPFCYHDVIHT